MSSTGRKAIPFSLQDSNGLVHTLGDELGKWQLLIFHRHLGWPPCRKHVAQLRDAQDQLDESGVIVKVVAFDNDFMAKAYVSNTNLKWPLLLDSKRELYRGYGMERGTFWQLYNPISILKYLWLIATGTRPGKPGSDWNQMGGDILIDPKGIVQMHFISSNPHDRPTVNEILELIK